MWMGSDQPELSSSPNFTDGSLTEVEFILPIRWCYNCLALRPWGSYHVKGYHLPHNLSITPNHLQSKDDIHISKCHSYNTQSRKTRLNRFCQFISTETWGYGYDFKWARPEKNKSELKVAVFIMIGFNRDSGIKGLVWAAGSKWF